MSKNIHILLLISILLLATFLRIFNLADNPIGLNQDEAVNGYDAYSIGETLKDHHGNFLPPMLESFEDWASPMITYVTVPFVKILGLSEFSIRLPVALMGIATVYLLYAFVHLTLHRKNLALLAAFLLAIMPWHITLSRWAIPPSIVPFFLMLTLCLFFWAQKKDEWWRYILVGVSAAMTLYSYPTQKVFVPMLLAGLVLIFFKLKSIKDWKKILAIGIPFVLIIAPVFYLTLTNPTKYNSRFSGVSITTMKDTNIAAEFIPRYLVFFTPHYNFEAGDPDTMHHVPEFGSSFGFMSIFFYLGIALCIAGLFKKNFDKRLIYFLLFWLIVFPIPAALTRDYFHLLRAVHGLPLVIIFFVIGTKFISDQMGEGRKLLKIVLVAISIFSIGNFAAYYFYRYPDVVRRSYQWGIKEYSNYLLEKDNEFSQSVIDNRINSPYIYYLFYSKYDPKKLDYSEINETVNPKTSEWDGVHKVGKYSFRLINENEISNGQVLKTISANGQEFYKIIKVDKTMYVVRGY